MSKQPKNIILGAGMTGLAAGCASGLPIYEAQEAPGGICSSYYMKPGSEKRLYKAPEDDEAYRFEIGGGHWIFGGDSLVLRFIRSLAPVRSYQRLSAVFFPDRDLFVPYPLQNHLRYLGQEIAARALEEITSGDSSGELVTMADWLRQTFGSTLYNLFFAPFHQLYTAGLFREIAPQDAYKTPVNQSLVIRGAFDHVPQVGYNINFIYPEEGLNTLAQRMAERCMVHSGKSVVKIDVNSHELYFEDGSVERYNELISTLPLNRMLEMTDLEVDERPDPATSVLVVNIGAVKGVNCPKEHWLYIPFSKAGFHRVGFYSNVDVAFLPDCRRRRMDAVSIYVEKAYCQTEKMDSMTMQRMAKAIVQELQSWGWIGEVEVMDTTWIDIAYTWSWPNSSWRLKAIQVLEKYGIYQVGRYARWKFQGITDSVRDGLVAGGSFYQGT